MRAQLVAEGAADGDGVGEASQSEGAPAAALADLDGALQNSRQLGWRGVGRQGAAQQGGEMSDDRRELKNRVEIGRTAIFAKIAAPRRGVWLESRLFARHIADCACS